MQLGSAGSAHAASVWTYGVMPIETPRQTIFGRHACYVPPKVLGYDMSHSSNPRGRRRRPEQRARGVPVGALLGDAKLVRTSSRNRGARRRRASSPSRTR